VIRNFTKAEWLALCSAFAYYEAEMENAPDGTQKMKVANRAFDKARQLAPENDG